MRERERERERRETDERAREREKTDLKTDERERGWCVMSLARRMSIVHVLSPSPHNTVSLCVPQPNPCPCKIAEINSSAGEISGC